MRRWGFGPVWIEERLNHQPFLDNAVGRAEDEDGRPALVPAQRQFTYQDSAAAVERGQHEQAQRVEELGWRRRAGQQFGDYRRKKE
nr:hypothetical protein [Anaerolineae bacterium]